MHEDRWAKLRETLERPHTWPATYTFKFIVPAGRLKTVREAAPDLPFAERRSENGRYVSLTATVRAGTPDEIVAVYRAVDGIEGLVSL